MATTPTKPEVGATTPFAAASMPSWPRGQSAASNFATDHTQPDRPGQDHSSPDGPTQKPTQRDALQALLAFSALHEQVRRRKALASRLNGFDSATPIAEFDQGELFVLDEVLQLVAERAVAITGADGLAIALADNNEIVLRASAGTVRPDVGARIDRDSAFSGACFRMAQVVSCDDTETDTRVNLQACRRMGARSMIAVPLCGRRRVIGLLEAFFAWPFGFNDSDIHSLSLLAELVVGALKPEDEDRFAESAQVAATKLEVASPPAAAPTAVVPPKPVPKPVQVEPAAPLAALPAKQVAAVAVPSPAPAILAPAILDKPAVAPEEAPDTEKGVSAETAPEPALFGQLESEKARHRPGMLVLLVCIVIAAAIAGAVWWKKYAQLDSEMVQTTPKPSAVNSPQDAASSSQALPGMNPAAGAQTGTDAVANAGESVLTPATPQELAKFPRVTGIRRWSSADSSTVVLDLEEQVQYEAHRLAGPDRIYFDLHDTQLAPELAGKSIEVGDALLSRIRVAQPVVGMTRIVLEIKADSNFSVSLESNPYRLVVEVRKIGTTPKGAVNLFPNTSEAERSKLAIVVPPPTREDLQLRARVPKMRIVVDAGHGGWDLGTVGRRGLLEKDLVLEIAQRLGKLLESRLGADVILTRTDDNYIPLDDRAQIANQAQADLFVSVHANYSDLPSARGIETYYTNQFSAPGSKDSDTHANAPGAKPVVATSLSATDLHERIEQSRRLAASVQRALYGTLSAENPGLRDRGIKEAGFVVLTESAMPGILAEVSFVSSPTDEQKLRSDGYREQIAEALYRGIARYAASSRGVKVAAK
ncbi:MAG: N-acetylmuramoyl-L-alanine amidase [Candidatus Sulfotelmatobacter sp.]